MKNPASLTRRRTRQRITTLGLSLIGTVVLLIALCIFYIYSLTRTISAESERYVHEVAARVSSTISTHIEDSFTNMHAIAQTCGWLCGGDAAHTGAVHTEHSDTRVNAYLQQMCNYYGFSRMAVITSEGMAHTTARTTGNLMNQACVQAAMRGEDAVSNLQQLPGDANKVIIYAVPLYQGNEIIGALAAAAPLDSLRASLDVETFSGEGFTHIIEPNGAFIFDSSNKNAITGHENYFTMLSEVCRLDRGYTVKQMAQNIAEGKSGVIYYTTIADNGIHKIAAYLPLEISNWYMMCIVPTSATTAQSSDILRLSILVVVLILALFLLLVMFILHTNNRNQAHLAELAYIDPVTGGHSRQWFEQESARRIAAAPAQTYALVSIDIRQFKLINDAFGSIEGNKTLRYIYLCMERHLDSGELATRIAADTFNLLLKNGTPLALTHRLDMMSQEINAYNVHLTQKYYLPLCAGIYVIDEPDLELISIQDRATVARKLTKSAPDSRLMLCAFYTDQERLRMLREKDIDNRMTEALDNREFVVYLQPKVSLQDGYVSSAEALVRWHDPLHGVVSPGEFIPAFERNGFIVTLDRYVFEEVCRLLRRWLDEGYTPVPISVNLSRRHLDDPDFLDVFQAIFLKYDIPAHYIEVELTETLVFENLSELIRIIEKIHHIGFTCSLDDFGSGYSSLNMLKDVPADVLKLDRAFFQGDVHNERGQYIVESVLKLAQKLQMRTVAEGVESPTQVEFLRGAHCDMVQGFTFARPMPVHEFEAIAFSGKPLEPQDVS